MREHTHGISRRAFLGGAAAFGVVSLANPSIAFATTSAEKQAEADAVRVQVTSMEEELSIASDNYYDALAEYDAAVEAMNACQVRIDETNAQIADIQGQLGTRARSMYRSGNTSFLDVLFGSSTFEEFTTNWGILNQMNQNDADMVEQSKTLREELQAEKDEYALQEEIAAVKTAEALEIKETAEATLVEMQALLDSLDEEARQLLEAEQQAAAEAAAAAERAAMEEATRNENNNNNNNGNNNGNNNNGNNNNSGGGYTGNGQDIPSNGSVVDYAASRLGCPYVWAANGPNSFDCSGLTKWCYAQVGITIPRTTTSQKSGAKAVMAISDAQPGDVLQNSSHVGIATVAGGGTYIHASSGQGKVCYSSWSQFNCALRF